MSGHHCGTPTLIPAGDAWVGPTGPLWRCDYCGHTYRIRRRYDVLTGSWWYGWVRVRPWNFDSLVRLRRQEHLDRARAAAGWDVKAPFWADPTGGVES